MMMMLSPQSNVPEYTGCLYFMLAAAFYNRQCVFEGQEQGLEYVGVLARTQSDEPCVRWDSVAESEGTAGLVFPDGSRTLAADYCRNPGGMVREAPWCYTDTAGTWNYCSITTCGRTHCQIIILHRNKCPLFYYSCQRAVC